MGACGLWARLGGALAKGSHTNTHHPQVLPSALNPTVFCCYFPFQDKCQTSCVSGAHPSRSTPSGLAPQCAGIRVIKSYVWEKPFLQRVASARDQELMWYRKAAVVRALLNLLVGMSWPEMQWFPPRTLTHSGAFVCMARTAPLPHLWIDGHPPATAPAHTRGGI